MAFFASHENHYVVACVRNMPLYMVCCPIENFGSFKVVTCISLGTIKKKKTLYIFIQSTKKGSLFVLICLYL